MEELVETGNSGIGPPKHSAKTDTFDVLPMQNVVKGFCKEIGLVLE